MRLLAPYDPDDRFARVIHRGARRIGGPCPITCPARADARRADERVAVANLPLRPRHDLGVLGRELRNGGYDVVHVHEPNAPVVSWFAAENAPRARWSRRSTPTPRASVANGAGRERRRRPPALQQARTRGSPCPRPRAGRRSASTAAATGSSRTASTSRPPGRTASPRPTDLEPPLLRPRRGAQGPAGPAARVRGAARHRRRRAADRRRRRADEVEPLLLDDEGVDIAGRVSDEEKWRLLHEADVLVAPSLGGESFGMVLTEAFASGTPVVASDIAGYRDVVRDGVDGVLVPRGRPRARSARRCTRWRSTPSAARRMGAAARERAERFAWPRVAERGDGGLRGRARACRGPSAALARAARRARPARRPTPGRACRPRRLAVDRAARPPATSRRRAARTRRAQGRWSAPAPWPASASPRSRSSGSGIEQIGQAARRRHAVWVLVAFALMCLSMLVRAEAWHAILRAALPRRARAPPRRRPRGDDRRADVRHAAGPPRRAVACADRRPPAGPRARALPGRARHARLADAAEPPRAGHPRHDHVRHRRRVPGRRGRARHRHDRAGRR